MSFFSVRRGSYGTPIIEENEILSFVSGALKSVWSLELLIRMRQTENRSWHKDELVREMRASGTVIDSSLATLQNIGLVVATENGSFRYGPLSARLADFAAGAERLYREKPVAVVSAIAATPNEKLRIFAEAFRLKDLK